MQRLDLLVWFLFQVGNIKWNDLVHHAGLSDLVHHAVLSTGKKVLTELIKPGLNPFQEQ